MTATAAGLVWRTGRGFLRFDKPCVMGVLNVTPDSFHDGGRHLDVAAALHRAGAMLAEGADIIDVGGESTRPGAEPISLEQEFARLLPAIRAIIREFPDAIVSVDTVKSEVADAAAQEGVAIINDVSGLRLDERIGDVVAQAGLGLVLMHSRGAVADMARYENAGYGQDVVADVIGELRESLARAAEHGVDRDQIVLDPGLGFSKRTEHSVAAINQLGRLIALGFPVLVGPSRKRFIGELSGGLPVEERLPGTLAAVVVSLVRGASIFRVHDVAAGRHALDVAHAVLCA